MPAVVICTVCRNHRAGTAYNPVELSVLNSPSGITSESDLMIHRPLRPVTSWGLAAQSSQVTAATANNYDEN